LLVRGQTQDSAYNSIVSYLGQTQIFNSIFTDDQWNVIQNVANNQNTIDELGNAVVRSLTDMEKFIRSSVGIVTVFVLVLVGVVVLILIIYVSVKKIQQSIAERKKREAEEVQMGMMMRETTRDTPMTLVG
jgi:hypothetical protein